MAAKCQNSPIVWPVNCKITFVRVALGGTRPVHAEKTVKD